MGLRHVSFLLLLFLSANLDAQQPSTEELKNRFLHAKDHRNHINNLFNYLHEGQSLHTDSFYLYARHAVDYTNSYGSIADKQVAYFYLAQSHFLRSEYDSATAIINTFLEPAKVKELVGDTYQRFMNLKAQVAIRTQAYANATSIYYTLLHYSEKRNDSLNQLICLTGLGWIQMELDQPAAGIPWFLKATELGDNPTFRQRIAPVYSNLAACYNAVHKNDSALYFVNHALELARSSGNLLAQANALNIQASIWLDLNKPAAAEEVLQEALEIRKELGDPFYIVSDMTELSQFYLKTHQPRKGIDIALRGLKYADSLHLNAKLPILYEALAGNYEAAGDHRMLAETLRKIIALKDSTYAVNSAESFADMRAKYEVQKNENIIVNQKLDIARKTAQLSLLFGIATVLLISGIFFFIDHKRRQRVKFETAIEKEKSDRILAVKDAEEKERKRIAADLHDNLGAYAAAISANIDNLEQYSVNTQVQPLTAIRSNTGHMVSLLGDTIWALQKDALPLTGISDRLKSFINRVQPGFPGIDIDVEEDISDDIVLSPAAAFDLFRIIQECINNALKHSGASSIIILFKSHSGWVVSISDNGRGIASGNIREGNGLQNIRTRAVAQNWIASWEKLVTGGTIVTIQTQQA